jgi:hypothetical protein
MSTQPQRSLARLAAAVAVVVAVLLPAAHAAEPIFEGMAIFPANPKHNHASCVVELHDGTLLAAWYAGSGERKSDDVVIEGAWLKKGMTAWSPKFLMADTPGYPDCNPALFAAPDNTLWLFWPTILDHRWEGALLKYLRRDQPTGEPTAWKWAASGVLHITPKDFAAEFDRAIAALSDQEKSTHSRMLDELKKRAGDELYQRLGWMPRVHPLLLPSGRWILPLYSDTFSASIMAISDDRVRPGRPVGP